MATVQAGKKGQIDPLIAQTNSVEIVKSVIKKIVEQMSIFDSEMCLEEWKYIHIFEKDIITLIFGYRNEELIVKELSLFLVSEKDTTRGKIIYLIKDEEVPYFPEQCFFRALEVLGKTFKPSSLQLAGNQIEVVEQPTN